MRRYLETFFRHPWLYLLLLMLVLVGSVLQAARAVRQVTPYTATATIAVNLNPTREQSLAEKPVAQRYAELLGELMETDGFLLSALSGVPLETGLATIENETDLAETVRARWKNVVAGPSTIRVNFQCVEPEFCTSVITRVLAAFSERVAVASSSRGSETVKFYQGQVARVEERLRSIPPTDPGYSSAENVYESLVSKLIDAELEQMMAARTEQNRFEILSPPQISGPPRSRMLAAVLPLGLGLTVGLALMLGAVALTTWLDRAVRTPRDVLDRLGLSTVALIPLNWKPGRPSNGRADSLDPLGLPTVALVPSSWNPDRPSERSTVQLTRRLTSQEPSPRADNGPKAAERAELRTDEHEGRRVATEPAVPDLAPSPFDPILRHLIFHGAPDQGTVVGVVGPSSGEGKACTAVIAEGLSRWVGHHRPVVTVDCTHLVPLAYSSTHSAQVGGQPPRAANLTANGIGPASVFRELRRQYSYVVLDLSPLVGEPLAVDLAQQADHVYVVIQAGITSVDRVRQMVAMFRRDRPDGVILTQARPGLPGWVLRLVS